MREKLVSNLSYRKSIINQTSAELYCNYCKTFICSLDNLKRYNNDKRYILSLSGKINEVDRNDEKVQKNPFVIEIKNEIQNIIISTLKKYFQSHNDLPCDCIVKDSVRLWPTEKSEKYERAIQSNYLVLI